MLYAQLDQASSMCIVGVYIYMSGFAHIDTEIVLDTHSAMKVCSHWISLPIH